LAVYYLYNDRHVEHEYFYDETCRVGNVSEDTCRVYFLEFVV